MQYNQARRLGHAVATLASERESAQFTPFVAVDKLPEVYRRAVTTKDAHSPPTAAEIARAREASLGLVIEATAQVAENAMRGGSVNDRLESLEGLYQTLYDGNVERQAALGTDRAGVIGLVKEAVGRRLGKPPDEVAMRDEDLTKWMDEQYQRASGKLGKGIEALRAYLASSPY